MFPLLLFALLPSVALGGCGAASTRPAVPLATTKVAQPIQLNEALPPRVFRDGTGIEVTMVFLAPAAGKPNQALIRFTGADLPLAGKVILATAAQEPNVSRWRVAYDGRQYTLLTTVLQQRKEEAKLVVRLYMPETIDPVKLGYHDQSTMALDVDAFIASHKRHLRDGSLALLAKVDRSMHESKISHWMSVTQRAATEKCGQNISYEIDWDSIGDDQLVNQTRCGAAFAAIGKVCARDELAHRLLLSNVKQVRCSHASENSLDLDPKGTLHLHTSYVSPMTDKDAYKALASTLKLARIVLTDERKRILVFDPDSKNQGGAAYLGSEKTLYKLRSTSPGALWDPHAAHRTLLKRDDAGWAIKCRKGRVHHFTPVSQERRSQILRNATFQDEERWKREAYALARDNRGNYYYVDRFTDAHGGKNYRVFRGPRGNLKVTKLIDIVDDSDGKIFATQRGKLRLLLDNKRQSEAMWIEGKKQHKLVVLPLIKNRELIYTGLGLYDAELMGTLCE